MKELSFSKIIIKRIFLAQFGLLLVCIAFLIVLIMLSDQLGSFIYSFIFGCFGGSISLARRIGKETPETLEILSESWISTLMPLLYGGLMAAILYMIFMAGLLTGDGGKGLFTSNLFPLFNYPALSDGDPLSISMILEIRPKSIEDAGKLLVWCFLAGYSEKFVTSILGTLENRVGTSKDHDR